MFERREWDSMAEGEKFNYFLRTGDVLFEEGEELYGYREGLSWYEFWRDWERRDPGSHRYKMLHDTEYRENYLNELRRFERENCIK